MSKYQYILLDWDGNLARTLDIWLEACRTVIERRGVFVSDQEIASSFGAWRKHLEKWGVKDIDSADEEADKVAQEKLPGTELYPDALYVLGELKLRGKKLALITTSARNQVSPLLEKYEMGSLFDSVVCGDDVEHHKPHPEPLEKALQQLGASNERAVMIGDSDKDLGAAKNAGIDSILFYPDEHKKFYKLEHLQGHEPTYIVDDFRNILKIV